LPAATNHLTNQSLQESILFATQEKLKNKKFPRFKKIKLRNRTVLTLSGKALNVNHLEQSECKLDTTHIRTDSRASGNKVLPQWGLTSFYETFVHIQTAVHLLNISAKNPPLRQYPKRYTQYFFLV